MKMNATKTEGIKRSRKYLIASCLLLILFTAAACGSTERAAHSVAGGPPCKAEIVKVGTGESSQIIKLSGVTEPIRRVTPATRLMAKVREVKFAVGDRVRAEQLLVRLDVRDLEAKRRQVVTAMESAGTAYKIAETNLQRMQELTAGGSTPQTNLEQMQISHAQASTALASADSALTELDTNLAYAVIRAPFDGIIVQRLVEVGNTVGPGQPLLIVEDDSRLRVVASVGTETATLLRPHQKIKVTTDAGEVEGEVEAVVSSGDTRAPGLRVNVLLDNTDHRLRPGVLANVEVPLAASQSQSVRIPKEALVKRGNLRGVYILADDSIAHLRWIVVEDVEGETARVITGIHAGERIVLAGDSSCVSDGRLVVEDQQ